MCDLLRSNPGQNHTLAPTLAPTLLVVSCRRCVQALNSVLGVCTTRYQCMTEIRQCKKESYWLFFTTYERCVSDNPCDKGFTLMGREPFRE